MGCRTAPDEGVPVPITPIDTATDGFEPEFACVAIGMSRRYMHTVCNGTPTTLVNPVARR
jgi:hypothetical protein